LQSFKHFSEPLIDKLNDDVKLVGSSISCTPSPLARELEGDERQNPHLLSHLIATDSIGLQLLIEDGKVLSCHQQDWENLFYSDKGASAAILKAGFNVDALQVCRECAFIFTPFPVSSSGHLYSAVHDHAWRGMYLSTPRCLSTRTSGQLSPLALWG
jgi:hypothetical protein